MTRQLRALYHLLSERLDQRWLRPLLMVVHFLAALGLQARHDQLPVRAAMLSYWTTVAVVPMLLLAFAMTGAIGLADDAVRELLYDTLLASSVEDVGAQLDSFLTSNSLGALGVVGVISIILIGAQLYFQTEKAYNDIFYCRPRQSVISRFFGFYAAITLAPLLIAGGFVATDRLLESANVGALAGVLNYMLPALLTATALVAAIRYLPSASVTWRSALWGGLTSAMLFEAAKRGFGAYTELLGTSDSMARIYGSLGLLPVFLLWLNVLWSIVLLGVEVAYVRENWALLVEQQQRWITDLHADRRRPDALFGMQVMLAVGSRFIDGDGPTSGDTIADLLEADSRHVRRSLEILEEAGLLVETSEGFYLPAVPLETLATHQVFHAWRAVTAPATGAMAPHAIIADGMSAFDDALSAPLSQTIQAHRSRITSRKIG